MATATKTRRGPTAAQKAAAAARRQHFTEICRQVAAMTEMQRAEPCATSPVVINCDGRPYSPHNTCLLLRQMPAPTIVGGFDQWRKHGRSVAKGQHGASILVPARPKKTDDNPDGEGRTYFISATVFDISQTVEMEAQR